MRMISKILAMILIAIALVSCGNDITTVNTVSDYKNIKTWSELFDVYWSEMSSHYIFWSLDDPDGTWWDGIYKEYSPRFKELGEIKEATAAGIDANTKKGLRLFFDIVKNLSDGHYKLSFQSSLLPANSSTVDIQPSLYRFAKNRLGWSDDDVFNFFVLHDTSASNYVSLATSLVQSSFFENSSTIMEYDFNIKMNSTGGTPAETDSFHTDNSESGQSSNSEFSSSSRFSLGSANTKGTYGYFGENKPFLRYYSWEKGNETLTFISGTLKDSNIRYIGFDGFNLTPEYLKSFNDSIVQTDASRALLLEVDSALKAASEAGSGVIMDLRGNGGGLVSDLSYLIPLFTGGESIKYAENRRKAGYNREEYGIWMPLETGSAYKTGEVSQIRKDLPIVVLINGQSFSCAEQTAVIFKELMDSHGFTNIRVIGETSGGAIGMLYDSSYHYYLAGVSNISKWITQIYTPFTQIRDLKGVNHEGTGVDADENIDFNYTGFSTGTDARLDAAMKWINEHKSSTSAN